MEYGAVDGMMEEDAPCRPINEYGKAKWEFYQKAAPLCSRLGLHYYHLRFFSVYGYGDHPWSIISTLVRDLRQDKKVSLSACRHMWNFMYIEDAVQAVYELYRQAADEAPDWKRDGSLRLISSIVNIASQDTRPLRSFVEEIHEIVGFKGTGPLYRPRRAPCLSGLTLPDLRDLQAAGGRNSIPSAKASKKP